MGEVFAERGTEREGGGGREGERRERERERERGKREQNVAIVREKRF